MSSIIAHRSDGGSANTVWMPHWGLSRDPFAETDSPYVSLPSHDEAVAPACLRDRNRAAPGCSGGAGRAG